MTTRSNLKRRLLAAGIAAPLLATTAFAFAQGSTPITPSPASAPAVTAAPAATGPEGPQTLNVGELRDMSSIQVEGRVAERFGNPIVHEDGTGRTLVETGPQGDRDQLVAVDDRVTVEGRFERGEVRATALTVAGGERLVIERPRPRHDEARGPGRGGPGGREKGPRGGPEERSERRDGGGWFGNDGVDQAAAETMLGAAGYTQIALVDTKKHHAEFTARDAAGATWLVKVDEDEAIREREPYREPMSEEATRTAVETLGYVWDGDFEIRKDHVEADARTVDGRSVRVEIASDGSLRKERMID